jgi:hypothetical protein
VELEFRFSVDPPSFEIDAAAHREPIVTAKTGERLAEEQRLSTALCEQLLIRPVAFEPPDEIRWRPAQSKLNGVLAEHRHEDLLSPGIKAHLHRRLGVAS